MTAARRDPCLPLQNNLTSKWRYWTYFAVPTADTGASREQSVLFRFQQVQCSGPGMLPPCKLLHWPLYWDSYWYSRFPGANASDTARLTLITGPAEPTPSWRFYSALMQSRRWWRAELEAEGMHELSLPSPRRCGAAAARTAA